MDEKNVKNKKTFWNIKSENYYNILKIFGIKLKLQRQKKYENISICLSPDAGLGNRLNALIFAILYDNPQKILMYWDTKGWVTKSFKDLFKFNYPVELNETNDINEVNKNEEYYCISQPRYKLKCNKKTFDLSDLKHMSKEFISENLNVFKALEPKDSIKSRIGEFENLYSDNFVALQVRNNADWSEFGRNEDLEKFFDCMDKFPKETKFYLSAMNDEISNIFKSKYPDRILELPNKDYSLMTDAVADLYIMAKAKNAIYSYGSTFAELAWWFSGADQNCTVIGTPEHWNNKY
jgi:hypothetical protein